MALSYPHTVTFDKTGTALQFDDGLKITVPGNTFDQEYTVTITKKDAVALDGHDAISAGYEVKFPGGAPDPLPPLAGKFLFVHTPLLVQVTLETALTLHTNPGDFPDPNDWTPKPQKIFPVSQSEAFVQLDELASFELTREES